MSLELVSEEVASPLASSLYPFNALRNHALLLVKTEVRHCSHPEHVQPPKACSNRPLEIVLCKSCSGNHALHMHSVGQYCAEALQRHRAYAATSKE